MPAHVAVLQTAGTPSEIDANLAELRSAALLAADRGADLLVTPEMFLTGYHVPRPFTDLVDRDLLASVQTVAAETGVALVVGGPEITPDGVYNAAFCVGADGAVLTVYRKAHLFGDLDRASFLSGDRLFGRFVLGDLCVAVLICYDVEFPETVRAAADHGAHLVVVPTAQMEPFALVADTVVPTRAWENQVYVAYANRIGTEGPLTYVGRSSVVGPDGQSLAKAGIAPELLLASVDPEVVRAQQATNPYLDDRRPDLYPGPARHTDRRAQ